MCDYADAKKVIEDMAAVKLRMNSHKGAIEDLGKEQIQTLLEDEVVELRDAKGMLNTIEEAADVYNFLMAMVHKEILQYRERK